MPRPEKVLRKLEFVTRRLLNEDIPPQLNQLFTNGHIDDNALQQVEAILTHTGRHQVLQILQQTLSGNYAPLEELERYLRYRLTQNNNPVTEEISGISTENGNIVHMETQDQVDGTAQNETCEDVEERSCDPRELRDPRMGSPRANQGELRLPIQEDGPFGSPQALSLEPVLGVVRAEERMEFPPPPCCAACGKNIQAIQTSRPVWSMITDIIKELSPQHLHAFITAINEYDSGILNCIQFHGASPYDIVNALQRCHLSGKCALCLLNYALQRIGRSDLTKHIKGIEYELRL